MATGSTDYAARIRALLPARWFGDNTPVLNSVLQGLAAGWMKIDEFLTYTAAQTRISTATDRWLDFAATDYFGHRIRRRRNEPDRHFRTRIILEINREKCTRSALSQCLMDLTGTAPDLFEPANPADTGGYGGSSVFAMGYGVSGRWGSTQLPFQVFVSATRAAPEGIALVNGWAGRFGGFGGGLSAYGSGLPGAASATDEEIYQAVAGIAPAGTTIWVALM